MSPKVNSIHKTNVPDTRVRFRYNLLQEERSRVSAVPPAPYTIPEKGERSGSVLSTTSTFKLQQASGASATGPKPLCDIILRELETSDGVPIVSASSPYNILNDSSERDRITGSAMTSEDDLVVGMRGDGRSRSLGSNGNGNNSKRRRHRLSHK